MAASKSKRKEEFPCGACKVHVKINDHAVQCYLCSFWFHQKKDACSDVDDALFKYLDQEANYNGGTYWACITCRVAIKKLDHRFKEHDQRLGTVEKTANENRLPSYARNLTMSRNNWGP